MSKIKDDLKEIVETLMIPEVEEYLEDLFSLLEKNEATEDDMNAIREMESFLVELENILLAIKENKIDDEQAAEVYENIQKLINDSEVE